MTGTLRSTGVRYDTLPDYLIGSAALTFVIGVVFGLLTGQLIVGIAGAALISWGFVGGAVLWYRSVVPNTQTP